MNSLHLSRNITDAEQEHFDRCFQYAMKYLAIYQPFFIYALYKLKVSPTFMNTLSTGYTDGRDIYITYPAALSITEPQFAGLILHELLHILNLHIPRLQDRHQFLWNIACDININGSIDKDAEDVNKGKIVMRPQSVRSPSVASLSCEDIYKGILDGNNPDFRATQRNPGDSEGEESSEDGTGEDTGDSGDSKDNLKIEAKVNGKWVEMKKDMDMIKFVDIESLTEEQKKLLRESRSAYFGSLPGGIERKVLKILDEVKVDWRIVLRRYITRLAADYSFVTRDRRFQNHPFFIPGVEASSKGSLKVSVGIDLSGSISEKDVEGMLTECIAIEKQFDFVEFKFIPFDVETYGVFTAKTKQSVMDAFGKFRGGGGTSFVKVLQELDTKDTIVILMFTDLYGQFPKKKPKTDVLWIDIGDYTHTVPFGKIIKYDHSRRI